jgi:cytochrome P450
MLVAGNNTITTTLVFCCYELTRHPHHVALIRREFDELRQKHGDLDARTLRMYAKHLNGVINETLRLWPGNPSGAFRTTPAGGLFVKEKYIPENVTVGIPQWSIMRCTCSFSPIFPLSFDSTKANSQPQLPSALCAPMSSSRSAGQRNRN